MYDYRAQRSDELSLFKGDVITVLYKDNDNWWMGELPDGQQGFFPSSYVAEEGMFQTDKPDWTIAISLCMYYLYSIFLLDSDNMADNRPVDDSDEDDDVAAVKKKVCDSPQRLL